MVVLLPASLGAAGSKQPDGKTVLRVSGFSRLRQTVHLRLSLWRLRAGKQLGAGSHSGIPAVCESDEARVAVHLLHWQERQTSCRWLGLHRP